VGPEPTVITPTLHAVQLDADAELESLKEIYAEELEHFFDNFSVGLSFDGDALAHLLDLAPTGIDEVMALVRMTELLEEHGYERIIIDTAPTGHTLRLLELPTVVRGWLSEILGVLAHYSHVIHLPKINERLIRFSKGLNTLRTMLSDPATCDIIAVAIPTHLSTAETRRLIAGCQAAGVSVSGVVINMITPPATGEWTRLNDRETACIAELRSLAGTRSLCEITRGTPPQGPSALTTIGARLLATPTAQTRVA
jgi:arsenite-transporting ATPase